MGNRELQNEAVENIIMHFCKDYNCVFASQHYFKAKGTVYIIRDRKRDRRIIFTLEDKYVDDISYMIKTKESLYDQLVNRYNDE